MTRLKELLRRIGPRTPDLDPYLVLLLALSLFALVPLLMDGYFYSAHDGRHSVFYVTMFDEAIRDGALWPRWAMHHNQGYGYPTFIVQAPLTFYVAELFILAGVGTTSAVKLTWAIGFIAGAWGMYWLVRHWLVELAGQSPAGRSHTRASSLHSQTRTSHIHLAGMIAGLLYIYIPYHLLDIYVRAALAETMLLAWFPWVFLAFDRLISHGASPGWSGRLLGAVLTYTGVLLTHVLALPAFTPLLVAFVLFRLYLSSIEVRGSRRARLRTPEDMPEPVQARRSLVAWASFLPAGTQPVLRVALAAGAGIASVLVAAIFILPLLAEGPLLDQDVYTENTYSFERHWVYWGQFFSPAWGYGFSDDPTGVNDGMGFQIGLAPLILAIVALSVLVQRWRMRDRIWWLMAFLLASSAAALFSMTSAAASIWRSVPLLSVIQFPWRLMVLSSFTFCALGGIVIGCLIRVENAGDVQRGAAGVLVLALLVIAGSVSYAQPEDLEPVEPWREDARAVFQFEQEHPDMYGHTRWVEEPFTDSPLTAQYREEDFSNHKIERLGIVDGEGEVVSNYSRGHSTGGVVDMERAGTVQIHSYYFPGWRVRVDGVREEVQVSGPHGLMEIDVPAGEHRIDARLGATPARTAGAAVSGLTLLVLLALCWWERSKRRTG